MLHPDLASAGETHRVAGAQLEEAVGLAEAIALDIVRAEIVRVPSVRPATLFGSGKVETLGLDIAADGPDVVIVNGDLSPVQHRNLERAWKVKVLDRTALILEIFGDRAQTREGRLQVDLAHLTYQKSRLVRSWTHLERQRGGAGFLGGPGETQIESDRRALANKIDRLKKQLEEVRRTRGLQRASRKRVPYPVIALVGYTNAGKSTLFNRLTQSDVMAKDMLFATLDPTMRAIDLPSGAKAILSDTVGFISNLPTQLVAAFRATLEEVAEADVILHVRDIAHEETEAQKQDVMAVLAELGIADDAARKVIEVANKIDCLDKDDRAALSVSARASGWTAEGTFEAPHRAATSAATGEGVEALRTLIDTVITEGHLIAHARVAAADGAIEAWLHAHGDVLNETAEGDARLFTVRLSPENFGRFKKRFADAVVDVTTSQDASMASGEDRKHAAGYRPL
ncbi:MAG: GTPase HflX [Pseudomonadota bacterium]